MPILNLQNELVKEPRSFRNNVLVNAQKILDLSDLSRLFTMQQWFIPTTKQFIKTYNIDTKQIRGCENISATDCLSKFATLNDFFARHRVDLPPESVDKKKYVAYLKNACEKATWKRIFKNPEFNIITCPVDNYCVYLDKKSILNNVWIKGKNFSIDELFGQNINLNSHQFMIFRLAPHHYHRFHSPVTGKLREMYYLGHDYYSVKPELINSPINVLNKNVRLILVIENKYGEFIFMAIIGATYVGSIKITHEAINKKTSRYPALRVNDELGMFQFGGSSVALCIPNTYQLTKIGEIVKYNTTQYKKPYETELEVGQVLFGKNL